VRGSDLRALQRVDLLGVLFDPSIEELQCCIEVAIGHRGYAVRYGLPKG
jgi:hypothetical protein